MSGEKCARVSPPRDDPRLIAIAARQIRDARTTVHTCGANTAVTQYGTDTERRELEQLANNIAGRDAPYSNLSQAQASQAQSAQDVRRAHQIVQAAQQRAEALQASDRLAQRLDELADSAALGERARSLRQQVVDFQRRVRAGEARVDALSAFSLQAASMATAEQVLSRAESALSRRVSSRVLTQAAADSERDRLRREISTDPGAAVELERAQAARLQQSANLQASESEANAEREDAERKQRETLIYRQVAGIYRQLVEQSGLRGASFAAVDAVLCQALDQLQAGSVEAAAERIAEAEQRLANGAVPVRASEPPPYEPWMAEADDLMRRLAELESVSDADIRQWGASLEESIRLATEGGETLWQASVSRLATAVEAAESRSVMRLSRPQLAQAIVAHLERASRGEGVALITDLAARIDEADGETVTIEARTRDGAAIAWELSWRDDRGFELRQRGVQPEDACSVMHAFAELAGSDASQIHVDFTAEREPAARTEPGVSGTQTVETGQTAQVAKNREIPK